MPTLIYPRGQRSWANGGIDAVASGSFVATAVPSTGRVTLAITWSSALVFTVQRVQNGVAVPVRGGYPATGSGGVTFSDVEAPLDIPIYYKATTPTYPFQTLTSNTVTLTSSGVMWLTHSSLPHLSTQVVVERNPDKDRDIDRGVFKVIGRRNPVPVVSGPRTSPVYTLDAFTETQSQRDNMLALLDDGSPLLLRTPAGYGFDAQTWLSIGAVREAVISGKVTEWARRWPLPCIEVDAPAVEDSVMVP
jgi:hypothetical protein